MFDHLADQKILIFLKKIPCQSNLPFVKKSLPLHFVNTKYITIPAASNYARFYGMEVQFYDYYEQKNHVEIGKIQLFKKQTKAVNQIKKATSYMLLRRCNRCSSAVCLQKKIKKFVYKSAVEHTLKHTQVTQIFHCRHSKKSEFPTHRSPKTRKKISKTKNPHDFFSKKLVQSNI